MRKMGIAGICPGPNLSKRAAQHHIYPYLLRDVTAQAPNQIWGCDITYVRLRGSWMYLVAILDWFSRYVVSWALDDRLELPFVLDAVTQALRIATPQGGGGHQPIFRRGRGTAAVAGAAVPRPRPRSLCQAFQLGDGRHPH